jgi:hypothetical protein
MTLVEPSPRSTRQLEQPDGGRLSEGLVIQSLGEGATLQDLPTSWLGGRQVPVGKATGSSIPT